MLKKIKRHPIFLFILEALLLTVGIGVLIMFFGAIRKWESGVQYSNAFFLAGALIFVGGAVSRISTGGAMFNFPSLVAETYKKMDVHERIALIIKANSPMRLVLLGAFSGGLLIMISVIFSKV